MATRKTRRFDEGGDTEFGDLEGAMDAAKARAVQDQFNANEAANETPTAKAATSKSGVVTKEQLAAFQAKNGADKTLRDYMNAQQNLTRRGDSTPASSTKSTSSSSSSPADSVVRVKPKTAVTSESYDPNAINFGNTKVEPKKETPARKYTQTRGGRLYDDERTMKTATKSGQGRASQAFAKGGMTASKRADGIAVRGKTRGRVL